MTASHDVSSTAHEREWQAAMTGAVVADAKLGVLAFDGADAADFLQGQLSTDVRALEPGKGQWTTYNSPKGRMLASLYLVRDPAGERYWALLASALAAPIAKRLTMFVLRAKVAVVDAGAAMRVFAIGGPLAPHAVARALGITPSPGGMVVADDIRAVGVPDGRVFVIVESSSAPELFDRLARHATPASETVLDWLTVKSGVPMITPTTQDLFVAQAANFDALGGIDFRKGCYTGQEIIARMQYLGRLKERLFAFRSETAPPAPGTRLYADAFGEQASGTVVNSAPDPDGGARFLAVAQIEAANAGAIRIGAPDGPVAVCEALPYAVPEPQPPRARTRM